MAEQFQPTSATVSQEISLSMESSKDTGNNKVGESGNTDETTKKDSADRHMSQSFHSAVSSSSVSNNSDAPGSDSINKDSTTFSLTNELPSDDEQPIGERHELLKAYEEDSPPLPKNIQIELDHDAVADLKRGTSFYGHPLDEGTAESVMMGGDGGLVWHATIIPDKFFQDDGKLRRGLGLPKRDFDFENRTVKPRRPTLPVTKSDFFRSLTMIKGPRWIFHGVLNGWPALQSLELISLERRRDIGSFVSPKELVTGQILWKEYWRVDREGLQGIDPALDDENGVYRAKLRGAEWTSIGWSRDSPGFVFWFEYLHPEGPKLTFGTNIPKTLFHGDVKCTHVHMVSHRYAVRRESPRDKLTYHSVVLLEWEHGEYMTLVEGAFLNGMGGYKGKSNWYDDRDESVTSLFRALPAEMICPWLTTSAEIRCYDITCKNLDEFKAFITKYEGNTQRFVDPRYTFSHQARLTYRTKANIAAYLLNYIGRDMAYSDLRKNCQTFAADFCSFICGKKGVEPFHPVNRIDYRNQTHFFLYESHLYKRVRRASHKKQKMPR